MSNNTPLPSFKEQIAVVYNDYMDTMGGGERSTLAYAKALMDLGFETEIVSTRPVPSAERIANVFGDEYKDVPVKYIKTDRISKYLKSAELSVFVNHTYFSFAANPARLGIYSQMFPCEPVNRLISPERVAALASYRLVLSNSSFTKRYSDVMWEYPNSKSFVLHPPINTKYVELSRTLLKDFPLKQKQFVNIGRFNPGSHNKNQKILIEAFQSAQKEYSILKDWKLILIGNTNDTPDSQQYLADCQTLEKKSPESVKIINNISSEDLSDNLKKSFAYVHGTGAFTLPGQNPQSCEHFGLSIVEAMAHGAIPLVYARGGIFDVLKPGEMGVPYITFEGLREGFLEIAKLWGTDESKVMQKSCLEAASDMGQESFTRKLAEMIAEGLKR